MIKRQLDISNVKRSFFLFGPRQVGKTYLIKHTINADIYIDLLNQEDFLRYMKDVTQLGKDVAGISKDNAVVVIDEIQRCPELLNEVQRIMDNNAGIKVIMTGSSARKLKRVGVNLLGGRAITFHLYPLTYMEIKQDFDLDEITRFGSLPNVFIEKDKQYKARILKSYIETYIKEEIQQESLVRNLPAFSRFLELSAHENGNILNFQNISRETAVHSKTIKEYFCLLEDTLVGFFLYPFMKSNRQKLVSHPKFYFFDTGVAAALRGDILSEYSRGTPAYGWAFEHFIILETKRFIEYTEKEIKMYFFRTNYGTEVDLILESADGITAIEIKSSVNPQTKELHGLTSFMKDHNVKKAVCVCQTPRRYISGNILFLPWQEYLEKGVA